MWSGAAAPVLYVMTVLVAGIVMPGYDQIADPISALTAAGRSQIKLIEAAFGFYNLLLMAFAAAGLASADRNWHPVFITLMVTAATGLLMWPFRMDLPGAAVSACGLVHIALAAVASVSTLVAVGLSIRQWQRLGNRAMTRFSTWCVLVIAVSGLATAIATGLGWPVVGLLERVTIGGFQLWLGITALQFAMPGYLAPAARSN